MDTNRSSADGANRPTILSLCMDLWETHMRTERGRKILAIAFAASLALTTYGASALAQSPPGEDTTELRTTQMLHEGWRFVLDNDLSDEDALDSTGEDWDSVTLPHTWNAEDAASLHATNYERGRGWYRLEFATPTQGSRHWLEFGAASLVADVWLNDEHLGQHKGGFTAFRYDITEELAEDGENVLLVKVDNNSPPSNTYLTAIAPLGGDFNVSGGLYRHVSLISTRDPVHFALGDMGGPGVYASTTSITGGTATVNVEAKVRSDSSEARDYMVRIFLLDDTGGVAASSEQAIALEARGQADVDLVLDVANAHLWHGRADPYLYDLVAELFTADGTPIDRIVQRYGIREMRFDPAEGFFLNGERMRLNGVAMHQDYQNKGWIQSEADWDTSFALIMEIGANLVRFGHYPFPQYAHDRADELGLVVWAEKPNGQRPTVDPCGMEEMPDHFVENANQQTEEMVRQLYNHASVAVYAVGNEITYGLLSCDEKHNTVTPYLRELHALVKELDPVRHTAYAEYAHGIAVREGAYDTQGITDIYGTNRYFLWYTAGISALGPILDDLVALQPDQPLGITEYGGGSSIDHHSDNPRGGLPDIRSAPEGEIAYQPEEYAAYLHEQNYQVFDSKSYLWGTTVWNMFDFGSDHRREGGLLGVNTKGLVTYDRQVRKDPFFYYKANWSDEPVVYIAGRRYTDRAYAVNDVKVYSNAELVELSVNGEVVGTITADQCLYRTCVFSGVRLNRGSNSVVAMGTRDGEIISDQVEWNFDNEDINIAAGNVTTGYRTADGDHFGSDNYFGDSGDYDSISDDISNTDDPVLYEHLRWGEFSYEIPVDNGTYTVTLGFVEPYDDLREGERVFDVSANGEIVLDDFDILRETGEAHRVNTQSFTVDVSDGTLHLEFTPSENVAVVSTIRVSPNDSGDGGSGSAPPAETDLPNVQRSLDTELDAEQVEQTLRSVADWQLGNPYEYPPGDWTMAILYNGLIDTSLVTAEPRYLAAVIHEGRKALFAPGENLGNADSQAVGYAWLRIYQMDPPQDPEVLQRFIEHFNEILESRERGIGWSWADALYMAPPTLARLAQITGDERFLDLAYSEFLVTYALLYDREANLFYRDERYIGEYTEDDEKVFWSRGNGWVYAALAEVLSLVPSDHPSYQFYLELYERMSLALLEAQQPDGLWYPNLADPEHVPIGETSGSGMFLFGIAWGLDQGILDEGTYLPALERGWEGLLTRIGPDGEVNYVQPIGAEPEPFEPDSSEPFGTGAVLGAGAEIMRLLNADADVDPAQLRREADALVDAAPDLTIDTTTSSQ